MFIFFMCLTRKEDRVSIARYTVPFISDTLSVYKFSNVAYLLFYRMGSRAMCGFNYHTFQNMIIIKV